MTMSDQKFGDHWFRVKKWSRIKPNVARPFVIDNVAGQSKNGCFLLFFPFGPFPLNSTICFWGQEGLEGGGRRVGLLSWCIQHLGASGFYFTIPVMRAAGRQSLLLFKLLVLGTDLRNPVYWIPSREVTAEGWRQWEPSGSGEHGGALQVLGNRWEGASSKNRYCL